MVAARPSEPFVSPPSGSLRRRWTRTVEGVLARMDAVGERIGEEDARRYFHEVYLRTT
jgi:hypothetical protein